MATATRTQPAATAKPVQAASAPAKAPSAQRQGRSLRRTPGTAAHPMRRASDRNPAPVYSAALADALEARIRDIMGRAIHRGVLTALRQAAGPQRGAEATSASAAPEAGSKQAKNAPEVRNGITCPEYGTVTGKLWLLYGEAGAGVTLAQAKELARANGLNEASAAIALYNWRKFHGVPNPSEGH